MEQLAIDCNCSSEDFKNEKTTIVESKNVKGRRIFNKGEFFFKMATFGRGSVVATKTEFQPFIMDYSKDKAGHWLFEHNHLRIIESELSKYNKALGQSHHCFLPDMKIMNVPEIAPIKWFERDEISKLYESDLFHNALGYDINHPRPDMLAVASYDDHSITGLAGVSADCEKLWQIGIDVVDGYRGRGLGSYLVMLMKNEVIQRGYIPYYGTSLSNIHSQNIAVNSGFFPAWVEINTNDFQ